MKTSRSPLSLLIVRLTLPALLVGAGTISCKRKEAKQPEAPKATVAFDYSKTLVRHIPDNSFAFAHFDLNHPAYNRWTNSPWGVKEDIDFVEKLGDSEVKQAISVLKKAQIDITDKKALEGIFTSGVLFAAPGKTKNEEPLAGILFNSKKGQGISEKAEAIKGALASENIPVKDLTLKNGTGFQFKVKVSENSSADPTLQKKNTEFDVCIGWNKSYTVAALTERSVDAALGTDGNTLPKLLESPTYKKATQGFPGADSSFSSGFFDLKQLVQVLQAYSDNPESAETLKNIPLEGFSFSTAMTDVPENYYRLLYSPENQKSKTWFKAIGASTSADLIATQPSNPILFASLDGSTIRRVKDLSLANLGAAKAPYEEQFKALDGITRLSLSAEAAPLGQSMLPVPGMLIAIETKNASELRTIVSGLVEQGFGGAGMPAGNWQTKTIEGTEVKFLITPLGMGVFLATQNNLVIAASTEALISTALKGAASGNSSFAKAMTERTTGVLKEKATVGNLYVNFKEVGSLFENLGGMLSMYAPDATKNGEFLQKDSIENMKKMGVLVGSVTVGKESVDVSTFYQPIAANSSPSA